MVSVFITYRVDFETDSKEQAKEWAYDLSLIDEKEEMNKRIYDLEFLDIDDVKTDEDF